MMNEKDASFVMEVVREATASDIAVKAHQALVQRWEKQEREHLDKIQKLTEREKHIQDRINAQRCLHEELQREVNELRTTLAEQLAAKSARALSETLDPDVAQFIRAARLLIQPGKKLSDETLRALGLRPPEGRGRRPSEHYVRSIATLVLPVLGFEIVESRGAHPDLICVYEGRTIGVEVEVSLNDYDTHGHDASDAHVVVCWTPPTAYQLTEGFFKARNVATGYSNLLSVVTLKTPLIHGNPLAVGHKKFSYPRGT